LKNHRCDYNILLIEDDEDTGQVIVLNLVEEGFGVRWVRNRDDALAVLQHYLYDIAVMDYLMPGMDADTFIREAGKRCPRCRVMLISAVHNLTEVAGRLGVCCWLQKPVSPETLMEALRKC